MAATRKKGDYSVLSEINTEDEWQALCLRKVSGKISYILCLIKVLLFFHSIHRV